MTRIRLYAAVFFLFSLAAVAQVPEPEPSLSPSPTTAPTPTPDTMEATTSATSPTQPQPEEIIIVGDTQTKTIEAPPASNLGWQSIAVSYITALQIVLVPLIVGFIKSRIDRLNPKLLPVIAIVIGVTSDLVATILAGGGFDPFRGSLVGVLGLILRKLTNLYVLDRLRI
jgi:hypothetical protein